MQYSVIGSDGNQYGPVDLITLKQWVADGRVMPHTQVIDNLASTTLMANQMPELGMTSVTGHYANTTAPPQALGNSLLVCSRNSPITVFADWWTLNKWFEHTGSVQGQK